MRRLLKILGLVLAPLLIVLFLVNLNAGHDRKLLQPVTTDHAVGDAQFQRSISGLLGIPLVNGNRVEDLQNGDEIFPAMLAAIGAARQSVTFETFIYWSGDIGLRFAEALAGRARAGVPVHVLLDALGIDKIDEAHIALMESAGVQLHRYRPLHWYTLARMNNRTHRKILVVDGRVAFTGGVGVADVWLGNADSPEHWRDAHFRMTGPVVAQIQGVFMDNWLQTTGAVLQGERYFPRLDSTGPHLGQIVMSSPSSGSELVRLSYLMAIAAARHRILIANAYFVPDDLAREALVTARRRGVAIDVIVPSEITDAVVTRSASRSRWGPLLEAGVRIFEYQPTMFHTKMMIVDGAWVAVGSANFDNRSFRLNDEVNLNIIDTAFAARQEAVLAADLARSRQITLEEWRNRPKSEKLKEWIAGLFRMQL